MNIYSPSSISQLFKLLCCCNSNNSCSVPVSVLLITKTFRPAETSSLTLYSTVFLFELICTSLMHDIKGTTRWNWL